VARESTSVRAVGRPSLHLTYPCQLAETSKGEGDDSMSGKGRVGKEVVLSDRPARCRARLKMDFLNSSPVVSRMTPAKTTRNAGLGMRRVPSFCVPLQHSQHTLYPEEKGERRTYTRRILLSPKTWDRLNRVKPAWRRKPNITQRTAVMACADLFGGPDMRDKRW
jgi:hypothetical protein